MADALALQRRFQLRKPREAGESFGDTMRNLASTVLQTFLQVLVQMGVQAVVSETLHTSATAAGAATRTGIRIGETVAEGENQAAQVGVHAAGETAKTGATFFGSVARGAIRVGETIFHALQVAFRVAAHFAGEVAKTAATLMGAAMRIPIILAESVAYVFEAAVGAMSAMASIPYVGPILAVAAAAAILGAGMGLVKGIGKGFAEGGYTGAGGKYEIAGPAHRGEVYFSQADVARHGGPAAVEDLRVNGPSAYARFDNATVASNQPGLAAASTPGRGPSAGYGVAPAEKPQRTILIVPDMHSARALERDPNFQSVIVSAVKSRLGEIFEA